MTLYQSKNGGGSKKDGSAESDPAACNRGKRVCFVVYHSHNTRFLKDTCCYQRNITKFQLQAFCCSHKKFSELTKECYWSKW